MQTMRIWLWVLLTVTETRCLELNDACDPNRLPYSSNPQEHDYNRCDPQKGLYCNTFSRCDCYVVDSYYDDYEDRCLAKIGHPCQATPTFHIPCGEWAECEPGRGFCKCRDDYTPNDDRKGCSAAGRLVGFGAVVLAFLVFVHHSIL